MTTQNAVTVYDADQLLRLHLTEAQAQDLQNAGITLDEYEAMQEATKTSEAEHAEPVPVRYKLVGQSGAAVIVNETTGEIFRSLTVTVPFFHTARVLFQEDESDENKAPACSSHDGKTGRYVTEYGATAYRACTGCPFDAFGSAADGSGKACKTMRRLYIRVDGGDMPAILNLPPSSLKVWDKFVSAVMYQGQTVASYELELTPEYKSRGQYQWAQLQKPKIVRELSPVERAKVMKIGRELEAHHREVTVGVADYLAIDLPAPATEPEASAAR